MDLWYLLPVAVVVAIFYTSTGVSGANFWVPIYLLVVGVDTGVGFWLALLTMLFGSSAGLVAHLRQRTIHPRLAGEYLLPAAPMAAAGALLAGAVPSRLLLLTFGFFCLGYGGWLLLGQASGGVSAGGRGDRWLAALGGFLVGVISVGLGAFLAPRAVRRPECSEPARAAGTVLVTVFLASLTATVARLRPDFVEVLWTQRSELLRVLAFVIPGVVLGGLVGPGIARRLRREQMRRYVAALILLVAVLVLIRAAWGP